MKPRYLKGIGEAPVHLSDVSREPGGRGRLVFPGRAGRRLLLMHPGQGLSR